MAPTTHEWFWLGIKTMLFFGFFLIGLVFVLANVIAPHRHVSRRVDLGTRLAGALFLLGALGLLVSMVVG